MLTAEEFKLLNKRSALRPILDIAGCWAVIGAALYLTHLSLFFLPVSILVIASRLHALTLLFHDGSHHLLHEKEWVNDTLSNLFCSFPLMISTEVYRKTHYRHHQFTQTMSDPNYVIMQREEAWHFPKPKSEIKRMFIKDFLLLSFKDHMVIFKDWQFLPNFKLTTRLEKYLFPLYLVSVLGCAAYFHLWQEFFVLQGATLFVNPFARMRAMSEHIHEQSRGQSKIHKLQETPTINANWVERFFFAPFNTNRHLEHHLFPTIPYYNLELAHQIIKKSELYKVHCRFELDGYIMGKRTSLNEVLAGERTQMDEVLSA